ncbi:hypothetical protein Pcar_3465 [Syntrophotalea carbinolica DSM 2380]|uniref:Uncharacterized protein n=1 Tax=Syntrophotalea carbinolica (strain DSM 2380 / NBRC 103641 / GraBd1) TaxID=338963 RepID=J9UJS5_SYNC1|nr:hypothetical protein Pcar_3465 [Syntrophotalea carbinolica DSM 2380]
MTWVAKQINLAKPHPLCSRQPFRISFWSIVAENSSCIVFGLSIAMYKLDRSHHGTCYPSECASGNSGCTQRSFHLGNE